MNRCGYVLRKFYLEKYATTFAELCLINKKAAWRPLQATDKRAKEFNCLSKFTIQVNPLNQQMWKK